MNAIRSKLIIAAVVVVAAVSYLASASLKSGWVYYLEVDRYLSDQHYTQQRVRLHGKVASEDFVSRAGLMKAEFTLRGTTKELSVIYRGAIPDQFAAGRDVVVEGQLNSSGVFQADLLMTKCASKYEPGSPHAGTEKRS
jgi:cytochrome c-type biogenesis protein CcmE